MIICNVLNTLIYVESLELRRIYNDVIMVYKICHGLVNINANKLIHMKTSTSTISTIGHHFKLQLVLPHFILPSVAPVGRIFVYVFPNKQLINQSQ